MNRVLTTALAMSVAVHGAVGWALLRSPSRAGASLPATPPELEIEFVDQSAETAGVPATTAAAPPPALDQQPPVPAGEGDDPVPLPTPPAPAQPAPPGPASPVRINVAGGEEDREALLVTGDDVVPPRPDAAVRNRPPAYPAAAARRHAQGTVRLVVHVTEAGVPAGVEISATSGDAALDEAARDAVALWRFRPALSGGRPVPFDFLYNVRFTLGSGRRSLDGQDRPRFDPGG